MPGLVLKVSLPTFEPLFSLFLSMQPTCTTSRGNEPHDTFLFPLIEGICSQRF